MPRAKSSDEEFDPTADRGLDTAGEVLDEDSEDDLVEEAVSAESKASALRLLTLLVEKKGLQLHVEKPSADLIEAVARVLDWPGPPARKATKMSEMVVDHDDVDDLFVDDDTLAEILKRW